jgi:hypothetical protein
MIMRQTFLLKFGYKKKSFTLPHFKLVFQITLQKLFILCSK